MCLINYLNHMFHWISWITLLGVLLHIVKVVSVMLLGGSLVGAPVWLALQSSDAASSGYELRAEDAAPPSLRLGRFQSPEGLIQTYHDGVTADPYFGLYALDLADIMGLDTREAKQRFIAWGLQEQRPDGRFEKYCLKEGSWERCGIADSDDATLARWMLLLYTSKNWAEMPANWKSSLERADRMLMSLRMRNGIFSVFPHDTPGYKGYALFKDNVEVLSAFEKIAKTLQTQGHALESRTFLRRAEQLRKAMKEHFGDEPFALKRLALGANYPAPRFYPHAVAIPFGWLEGYFEQPTSAEWDRWLEQHEQAWLSNAKRDFPWGVLAISAYQTGRPDIAACWLQRHTPEWRSQTRWNILEEVAAQALQSKQLQASNCPEYEADVLPRVVSLD